MTKYEVIYSNNLKKIIKQGEDLDKLNKIVDKLSNDEESDLKYKDHKLVMIKILKIVENYILNRFGCLFIK